MAFRDSFKEFALRFLVIAVLVATLAGVLVQRADAVTIAEKRAEAARVSARLAELDIEMQAVNAQHEEATYKLNQAEAAANAARALLEQTKADLAKRQSEVRDYAVRAYVDGGSTSDTDALLSDSAEDRTLTRTYLQTLSGDREDLVDSLNAARVRVQEDEKRLAAVEAEAQAAKDQIAVALNAAKAKRNEQAALKAKVDGELAQLIREEEARRRAEAEAARRAAAGRYSGAINVNAPAANGTVTNTAIRAGFTKVGSPYVWAAAGPSAFDCSGFTQWAFAQAGVRLPHFSGAQYAMTARISRSQLQPGDLVFWGGGGSSHVAIYIGGNQLLHAFGSGGVDVTALDGWWMPPSGYGRLVL
ncbi:MAG: hypothetical protein RLZZ31_215 [Actinomycetota bacterium]